MKIRIQRGFTLIEVLVAMVIVLIMTVTIGIAFMEDKEKIELILFRNELIAELKYIQARSINTLNNYGIHINAITNYAVLFKDVNNSGIYDTEEKIRNINIPEGITFLLLSPPSLDIVFQKDGAINTNRTITITAGDISIDILINSIGLIEIIN